MKFRVKIPSSFSEKWHTTLVDTFCGTLYTKNVIIHALITVAVECGD